MRRVLLHFPHVGNRGAHPTVVKLVGQLARARLASLEVWQHLLAEMLHHARLLGVHDGIRVRSKTWTSLTAIVKKESKRNQAL